MTGKDFIVIFSQNGTALASTAIRSQDVQTAADTIEKASATQQDWREFIAGRKDWALNVTYLVLSSSKLVDLLRIGQSFDVTIRDIAATTVLEGSAILQNAKQTAAVGNLASGSFSFKGNGPLAEAQEE